LATPSKLEIDKVQKKLEGFLKKLNPDGSPKRPMDDNLAKGLMRDAVRKKWMYSNTKLAFLLMNRIPDMDTSTRTKWLQECAICGKTFREQDVQVDHLVGETEFTEWGQAQQYASSILDVTFDDLQILCIPDHKTKTRCEQLGLDWRTPEGWKQGLLEQEFTKIVDSKAKGQKHYLIDNGVVPLSNEELRKQQIREVLGLWKHVQDL
jgi:hypothetical protein